MFKAKEMFTAKKEETEIYGIYAVGGLSVADYREMAVMYDGCPPMMPQRVYPFQDMRAVRREVIQYDHNHMMIRERCTLTGETRQTMEPINKGYMMDPRALGLLSF